MSAANPYAGITQIRFKGSLLSPYGHPLFSGPSLLLYFSKIKYFLSEPEGMLFSALAAISSNWLICMGVFRGLS